MSHDIYGVHLTLRIAQVEGRKALNEEQAIATFLADLVGQLGMRVLAGPLIGREEGSVDHAGCSGVIILYESHAAIHTYPYIGAAFIDIFSCKPFEAAVALAVIEQHFGSFTILELGCADRGIHWSADAAYELAGWARQR